MPDLVSIFLAAEASLERELAGLAVCQPQAVAKIAVRPEIDLAAIEFFKKFDAQKEEILAGTELQAITIAFNCAVPRDFFRFWSAVYEVNAYVEAPVFGDEIVALRSVRKAVQWIEQSGILKEWGYGGKA